MDAKPPLSDEELTFLQSVLKPTSAAASFDARFAITGSMRGERFLSNLAKGASLSLEARADQVRIRFALRHEQDGFGNLIVYFQAPELTDNEPRTRAWRATLAKPLPLLGELDGVIEQLSHSGALLRLNHLAPRFCIISCYLPNGKRLQLRGQRVRSLTLKHAAYRLFGSLRERALLNGFLYYQYQTQRAKRLP